MAALHYVAAQWRGGKLIPVWKGKGDYATANHSRGLMVSDHSGKVLTGLLLKDIYSKYEDYVGTEQFGCTAKRGIPSEDAAVLAKEKPRQVVF